MSDSPYRMSCSAIGGCSLRICWCTADTWHARRLPFVGTLIKTPPQPIGISLSALAPWRNARVLFFPVHSVEFDIQIEVYQEQTYRDAEWCIKNVALRMIKKQKLQIWDLNSLQNEHFRFFFLPLISMQFLVFGKGQLTLLWGRDFSYWIDIFLLEC